MAYQNPVEVTSPTDYLKDHEVICNTGPGGWAVAIGLWDGGEAVLVRWNGSDDGSPSQPLSNGKPIWFVVPPELAMSVKEQALIMAEKNKRVL